MYGLLWYTRTRKAPRIPPFGQPRGPGSVADWLILQKVKDGNSLVPASCGQELSSLDNPEILRDPANRTLSNAKAKRIFMAMIRPADAVIFVLSRLVLELRMLRLS